MIEDLNNAHVIIGFVVVGFFSMMTISTLVFQGLYIWSVNYLLSHQKSLESHYMGVEPAAQ